MHGFLTARSLRMEVLRDSMLIVGDDRIRHIEHIGSGAVVAVEHYGLIRFPADEFGRARAAPFIYGLVGIADNKQIMILRAYEAYYLPIIFVAVLSLVDHDVIERVLPILPHFRETVEQI